MFKFIVIAVLVLVVLAGGAFYSMQRLPSWFDETASAEQQAIGALSEQIQQQGVEAFLGNKLTSIVRGEVVFSEAEFNALLLASLQLDEDGRRLLQVTDGIHATLNPDQVELSAVFNLDKVEQVSPKARKEVERFDRLFFFLDDSRLALSVYGTPVVRRGKIGIQDDFHIKVGAIPVTNSTLRQLGIEVERANEANLALRLLRLKSVELSNGQIRFAVRPRI